LLLRKALQYFMYDEKEGNAYKISIIIYDRMKCVWVPTTISKVLSKVWPLLPQVSLVLRHFDNAYTTAEPPIVHGATQAPLILLRIVDFDRLQVSRAVKTAYSV
jgi:hypothetical protein